MTQATETGSIEEKKRRLCTLITERMGQMPAEFLERCMNGDLDAMDPAFRFWNEFLMGLNEPFSPGDFSQKMDQFFKQPPKDTSPLIIMRKEGSRTPFFCVHALLGSVYHYHKLASRLSPDQPFYGLQARGLSGDEEPLERIETMAELYLETIRRVQPQGPYLLGGYSFGGWVAFEMARHLHLAGEKVSGLIIIGAGLPPASYFPTWFRNSDFMIRYLHDFQKNVMEPFLSFEDRLAGGFHREKLKMNPIQRVYLAHSKARLAYTPFPYSGPITLFETIEQQMLTPFDWVGGWDQFTQSGTRRFLVSGNHYSMLDEPAVDELAEKLDLVLAQIHSQTVSEVG